MTPPLTLRTSPYRVLRKPSHRWHIGGLDMLFLPGHRAAVHGQFRSEGPGRLSPRAAPSADALDVLFDLRLPGGTVLVPARPLAHTVSLCISSF